MTQLYHGKKTDSGPGNTYIPRQNLCGKFIQWKGTKLSKRNCDFMRKLILHLDDLMEEQKAKSR